MTERSPAEGVARELRKELVARRAAAGEHVTETIDAVGHVMLEAERHGLRTPSLDDVARESYAAILRSLGEQAPRRRRRRFSFRSSHDLDNASEATELAPQELRQLPRGDL